MAPAAVQTAPSHNEQKFRLKEDISQLEQADKAPAAEISKAEEPQELQIANNASELIGSTPLVFLNKIAEGTKARIAGKLESLNPAGSVKDRIGLSMINDAEAKGVITPGKTVLVEATSGNTGIALATIAAQRGYHLIIIMPHTYSLERRVIMLQLGAKLVITDAAKGFQGVVDKLMEVLEKTPNSFCLNQFENPANPDVHFNTTGPEIWKATAGMVDIFISAVGTGGTISGAGRYLKSKNPAIRTVAIEPTESAVLSGGEPGPHKIQGTGPGFVSEVTDRSVIDEILTVNSDDALRVARQVARTDGLLVGISSGAAIKIAIDVANRVENEGKLIVVMLPSGGERYLSTDLYDESRKEAAALTFEEEYKPPQF